MLYLGLLNAFFLLRYGLAGRVGARTQLYYVVLAGLFVFSAFRYQVGCDWSGYYFQYLGADEIFSFSLFEKREPIWWLILSLIKNLGLPYPVANVISSGLFFWGVHVLARRQPDPLSFLILLFPILIINMPMSGIRQGAAIGLMCLAFVAFADRRPARFALWVLLASGFHASASVFMLLLPVATGRYTSRRLLLATFLAIPGLFVLGTTEAAEVAVSRYVGNDIDAYGAIFRLAMLGLSAVFFFWLPRARWERLYSADYSLANVGGIGMAVAMMLLPISSVIGDRYGYYLIPLQAMIFARIPFLQFGKNAGLYTALPYLGVWLVFTVWTQLSAHFAKCYVPYQSWVFGFPTENFLRYWL